MVQMKRSKLILMIAAAVLITLGIMLAGIFVVLRSSSTVLVPRDEYDRMKTISARYSKLYDMQETLQEKSLYDVSAGSQMSALYNSLADSMNDPYTMYLSADEAEKWEGDTARGDTVTSQMLDGGIGYLKITSFSKDTADSFQTNLKSLTSQGAKALIIDLRGNSGGYTKQGIEVADQLLPECTITSVARRSGKKKYYNSDETQVSVPYVLLVDHDTASASEIVAAAVKFNHGGTIVGVKTYGKGVFQEEKTFDDGSLLHYTAGEFFAPDGSRIHGVGVTPDVEVSGARDGSAQDAALAKAREILGA